MKIFADMIHMSLIAALVYPMFYLWDTSQVQNFCQVIETGMSTQQLVQLADANVVTFTAPQHSSNGKWHSSVSALSPFTDYSCEVTGLGNRVSKAWINS